MEVFGFKEFLMDVEVIVVVMDILKKFGLKSLSLYINNLGCLNCRFKYNEVLKKFLVENYDGFCDICKSRFEKNFMRILDCKEKKCNEIIKNVLIILDYMCEECDSYFVKVKEYLDILGIFYEIDLGIVRGLDYYIKIIFEIVILDFIVCGGGRYDKLIEEFGGLDMLVVGFVIGIERLIMILEKEGIEILNEILFDLYIGVRGEEERKVVFKLVS